MKVVSTEYNLSKRLSLQTQFASKMLIYKKIMDMTENISWGIRHPIYSMD